MPARHKSRQHALQVLFLWDQRHQPVEDAIADFYYTLSSEEDDPKPGPRDEFMEFLATGASRKAKDIDQQIAAKSANWRLERMPAVDRNILRLAAFEMQLGQTAAAIVIDEALELAREFSGDESVSFINGVLDAMRRESA
jgi:N utilization substance protein B